jgi:cell division cycle 20-like protein 1 (cofactor of APC complex)
LFSKRENEIITSHGFSDNEINIWNMKDFNKVGTLTGHTQRVLYMALNPNGSVLVTGAGDETLRFWNLGYQEREQT